MEVVKISLGTKKGIARIVSSGSYLMKSRTDTNILFEGPKILDLTNKVLRIKLKSNGQESRDLL